MQKAELVDLTIGSIEDYQEVKREIRKLLNIEEEKQLNKYKVCKTAKSKSNSVFYDTFQEAITTNLKNGLKNHVYKAMPTSKGIYWKKVY